MFWSSLSSKQGHNSHKNDLYTSCELDFCHVSTLLWLGLYLGCRCRRPCVCRSLPCDVSVMIQTEDYGLLNLALWGRSPRGSLARDDCRGLSIFRSTCRCMILAGWKERRGGISSSKAGLYSKSALIYHLRLRSEIKIEK